MNHIPYSGYVYMRCYTDGGVATKVHIWSNLSVFITLPITMKKKH